MNTIMHHSTVVIVQSLSHVQLFAAQWTATRQASLSFTNSRNLLKLHVHWINDAIQPSHLLSSPSPPAFNLFQHEGLFQWVVSSHQVAKYWNFSFSISPSNEYSGLISFKIDWFNLLAVQGTLKSLLQSDQIRSVAQSCPTLCDTMNCSTPGLPVHHQFPEFTQNSSPLSRWCHPTISSSVIPFSSRLQSFIRVFSSESVLCIR